MSAIRHSMIETEPREAVAAPEARDEPRYRTVMQSARLIGEGRQTLCVVRDISETGMKARLFGDVRAGERVCVEFKGGRKVMARVQWVDERFAGFLFDDRIDLRLIFAIAYPDYSYRSPRLEIDALAQVSFGRVRAPMAILDISVGGAKLLGGDALLVGEKVGIEIDGLAKRDGTVMWKDGQQAGIEFDSHIGVDRLADWANERAFRRLVSDLETDAAPQR